MIPVGVDIEQISREINDDSVSVGPLTSATFPQLKQELQQIAQEAAQGEFGSLGIVVLDQTPLIVPDLRDVAQEALMKTNVDTVAVRAPESVAVVSKRYSRSIVESGQYQLIKTRDYVAGTQGLVHEVVNPSTPRLSPATVSIILVIVIGLALVLSAVSFLGKKAFNFRRHKGQL